MFPSSMQPSIISLFSSTGELPLSLFSTHTDLALPSDSLIHILNDSNSSPKPFPPATLVEPPFTGEGTSGYCLDQSVLQIQSPTLSTTFIQCPSYNCSSAQETDGHLTRNHVLGLMHPWLHIQVRNMGREWSFEVGLVDQTGGCGIVRCSTFQKQPRLIVPGKTGSLPILHLPLSFPSPSSRPLTAWSTISLYLPQLLSHFSTSSTTFFNPVHGPSIDRGNVTLPSGTYSHVSFIRVYATCRLRRVWLSEAGPDQKLPWEFELYSAE